MSDLYDVRLVTQTDQGLAEMAMDEWGALRMSFTVPRSSFREHFHFTPDEAARVYEMLDDYFGEREGGAA